MVSDEYIIDLSLDEQDLCYLDNNLKQLLSSIIEIARHRCIEHPELVTKMMDKLILLCINALTSSILRTDVEYTKELEKVIKDSAIGG